MRNPEFLVLEASFLAGTYGGTEWPPAPFRLLQAMVAGRRGIDDPGLRWLESQPPPFILATDEPPAVRFKRSIPNNANPRLPQAALSLRDVIHRRVTEPVRYCYPLRTASDRATAAAVIAVAEQVHTLGTGEDMCMVRGRVAEHAPESLNDIWLWLPSSAAPARIQTACVAWLRVPVAGSLASLEERFQAFQHRLDGSEAGYARAVLAPARHDLCAYRPSDEVPRSAFLPLKLVAPDGTSGSRRFHPENAVVVAAMLRHAVMRLAAAGAVDLADFAAGYGVEDDKGLRMSWVPLPSIGHAHADGLIRRGAWMCRAADAGLLGRLATLIPEAGMPLVDEQTGECVAMAMPANAAEEPVLPHYLSPAAHWATITPMVLPGDHGAGDQRLMNNLLRKAVREAGIDPGLIEHAEFSSVGFMKQAARVREVKLKDWEAKRLLVYHVALQFREPIRGPVVLGRGRHFGLGLFCANPQ